MAAGDLGGPVGLLQPVERLVVEAERRLERAELQRARGLSRELVDAERRGCEEVAAPRVFFLHVTARVRAWVHM